MTLRLILIVFILGLWAACTERGRLAVLSSCVLFWLGVFGWVVG